MKHVKRHSALVSLIVLLIAMNPLSAANNCGRSPAWLLYFGCVGIFCGDSCHYVKAYVDLAQTMPAYIYCKPDIQTSSCDAGGTYDTVYEWVNFGECYMSWLSCGCRNFTGWLYNGSYTNRAMMVNNGCPGY